MLRLRTHHLLCVLTWSGRGYTEKFSAGFDAVAARLQAGEAFVLTDGPDDICAPRLSDPQDADHHCSAPRITARDRAARADLIAMGLAGIDRLDAAATATLRQAFADGAVRTACGGCDWRGLCDGLAASGFDGVRLHPPRS